jgi:hypothetical protein
MLVVWIEFKVAFKETRGNTALGELGEAIIKTADSIQPCLRAVVPSCIISSIFIPLGQIPRTL